MAEISTKTFGIGETVLYRPCHGAASRERTITDIEREGSVVRLHLDDGDAINIDVRTWTLQKGAR